MILMSSGSLHESLPLAWPTHPERSRLPSTSIKKNYAHYDKRLGNQVQCDESLNSGSRTETDKWEGLKEDCTISECLDISL